MPVARPLVECIVNVSEGRDAAVLATIAAAIRAVPGCYLLHQDTGAGAHRTVFTFAGAPDPVFAAARRVYEVALERIDMRRHHGAHPRIGAVDVCPFVAISGVTQQELVARTQVLAEDLGRLLGIPVFLYEDSAKTPDRRNLADLRRGEYEGLATRATDPAWQPDFGPAVHPTFGATVLGARPYLIAWNINLGAATPLSLAKALAAQLRTSGRAPSPAGAARKPGLFKGLKAIGWRIPEFDRCQISCNVVDAETVDLARVYLTAVHLAATHGATVTGSELIGLVPEKYLRKAGRAIEFSGDAAAEVRAAVDLLGLNDLAPFDPTDRVLEWRLKAVAAAAAGPTA